MRAGSVVQALDNPPPQADADETTQLNVSDTDFVAYSPEISISFLAPRSGSGFIIVGGGLRDDTGTERIILAPEVRLDDVSGLVWASPRQSVNGWTNSSATGTYQYGCRLFPLFGLIPHQTYFARVMVAVSGGSTADAFNGQIFWVSTT